MPIATGVFQNKEVIPELMAALNNAEHSIHIAVAWFSNYKIANALIAARKKGRDVKMILSYDERNFLSNTYNLLSLEYHDIELWGYAADDGLMHNKFCVIDERYTLNGSFNWTYGADYGAQENIVIADDVNNAKVFLKMWSDMQGEISTGDKHRKPLGPIFPEQLRKNNKTTSNLPILNNANVAVAKLLGKTEAEVNAAIDKFAASIV